MDTTVSDPLLGRLLDGRYRLDSPLARGGMATVWTATDTRLDRIVAVKVMRHGLAEDPAFVERFAGEARAAARLSSPHVVAVFDQGTDAATGTAYLVMELVEGHTLREVLQSEGALPPPRALALVEPVLRALAAAHRAGLVHRDVKPENVLVGTDGSVKVADFGLARAVESTNLTATTGLLIGTVAYLAPEQVEHGRSDTRTDVYATGVLLWELLTGTPPYASTSPLAVAYRHVNEDIPPPGTVVPGVPAALDELVVRATRRDPSARPVDAGAFLAELRNVRSDLRGATTDLPRHATLVVPRPTTSAVATQVPPAPGAAPQRPRRRAAVRAWRPHLPGRRLVWIPLLALLVAALLGTGGFFALTTAAPDVVGLTKIEAQQALTDAGFQVELLPSRFDSVQPAQHIIEQDPSPGGRLRRGGTVRLLNSLGPPVRVVPTVVGLSQDAAAALLVKQGLRLGAVTLAFSERPAGEVLSSDPGVGARRTPGSSVSVVVSKGLDLLPVPDVVGQSRTAAQKALVNAGLTSEVTLVFSDDVDEGDVVAQTPSGGSAPRDSAVALQVSKGPDVVTVPDVNGKSAAEATAALQAVGLKAKVTKVLIGGPGQVLRTSPSGGSRAKRGSTVTVYVF